MLITTLGTSHGSPTYCRYNSATLFEAGGHSCLVDTGEPVSATMVRLGKDIHALNAAFITHMHSDHVGGLPMLIKMLRKGAPEGTHTHIFLAEDCTEALGAWLRAMHIEWPLPMVTAHTVAHGPVYDDGVLRVSAEATRHLAAAGRADIPGSFAYVLEAEGKRVVHTGDLSADFSDFPRAARDAPCDLCLCEITHYPPALALPILMQAPIKRLVLTHVHDPWHGDGEADLRAMLADLPYPWHIAHDGDEFEL